MRLKLNSPILLNFLALGSISEVSVQPTLEHQGLNRIEPAFYPKVLEIPDAYCITSNYGMVVFNNASQSTRDFYKFISSHKAQYIFIAQGFAKL